MLSVVSRTVEQQIKYRDGRRRSGRPNLVLHHAKVYDSERYMTHFT